MKKYLIILFLMGQGYAASCTFFIATDAVSFLLGAPELVADDATATDIACAASH